MKQGDFHGYPTHILENDHLRLECLANAGPRVVRLIPAWLGENIFAEVPDFITNTELGPFRFLGGHRLWHAPESISRTYFPDHHGLEVQELPDGLQLRGQIEATTRIRKTMTIQLSSKRAQVILKHVLENLGPWPVTLAPWAITMMKLGGAAFLPQERGSADAAGLGPNRHIAMWPYARWDDPRLHLGGSLIIIKADISSQAFKIGYFNSRGWLGYALDNAFFVKRFASKGDAQYPDFGCNSEVYCNDRFLELESLGPLTEIVPGQKVTHTETWEVHREMPQEFKGSERRNL